VQEPAAEQPAPAEQEAPTAAPAAEAVTIRWLTRAVDWGGQEAGQEVPKLVEKYFYPEHPDIKVVVEPAAAQWEEAADRHGRRRRPRRLRSLARHLQQLGRA
jgi:hypothetical protein